MHEDDGHCPRDKICPHYLFITFAKRFPYYLHCSDKASTMIARRRNVLVLIVLARFCTTVTGRSVGMRGVVRRLCDDTDCVARHKKHTYETLPPSPAPTLRTTESLTVKPTEAPVIENFPLDEAQGEEIPVEGEPADTQETSIPFETEGSVEEDTGKISTCKLAPIDPPPASTTVLYTYEMKMTAGANMEEILVAVEEDVHNVLSNKVLNCNFSGDSTRTLHAGIQYSSVSSLPKDSPVTAGNNVCGDDQDCYKVRGGITAEHLPWSPESDIIDQVRMILTDSEGAIVAAASLDLRAVEFTSFSISIDETSDVADTPDHEPVDESAFVDDTSSGPSRGAIAGGVTIAVVALGVTLAALLVARRIRLRRNTAAPAVKSAAQDKSVLLDDSSTSSSSDGFKTVIINDKDSLSPHNTTGDTAIETSFNELKNSHDPDSCTSAYCTLCEEEYRFKKPDFVSVPKAGLSNECVKDLTPPRISGSVSERTYVVSDTVSL